MSAFQIYSFVIVPLVTIGNFLLALWTLGWHKKESRHEALASLLKKMMYTVQLTTEARRALGTAMELERSFSGSGKQGEALQRANHERRHYEEAIAGACKAFREMELELVATGFRFPDKIRESLKKAAKQLAEFGHLVQDKRCDAADVKNGELADTYNGIVRHARGWRLTDPFEGWWRNRKKKRPDKEAAHEASEFDIDAERMDVIDKLVYKRMTQQSQQAFAVHPPKLVLDDPAVLGKDSVIDELRNEHFKVVFQDGTAEVLGLAEFVFFMYQLIFLQVQMADIGEKLHKGGFGPAEVRLKFSVSIPELIRPEVVKAVLSKVDFSPLPAEDEPASTR